MKYRVITSRSLDALEYEVNTVLANGGELIGGIMCVKLSSPTDLLWSQAVLYHY